MQSNNEPSTNSTGPTVMSFDGYVTGTKLIEPHPESQNVSQVGTYIISKPLASQEQIEDLMSATHGETGDYLQVQQSLQMYSHNLEYAYIIGRLLAADLSDTLIASWSGGGDSGGATLSAEIDEYLASWESEMLYDLIHSFLGYGSYAGEFTTEGSVYFDDERVAITGEGECRDNEVVDTHTHTRKEKYPLSSGLKDRFSPIDTTYWVQLESNPDPNEPEVIRTILNVKDGPIKPSVQSLYNWIKHQLGSFLEELNNTGAEYYQVESEFSTDDDYWVVSFLQGCDSTGDPAGFVIGLGDDQEYN